MYKNIFRNKTIIVTGHTGFKGSWLCIWLSILGAKVIGLSDKVYSKESNFVASNVQEFIEDYRVDIRDSKKIRDILLDRQPDFIFHMAAQALVRPSYIDPLETMGINAIGSANILDALRFINKKVAVVMITSDKAYDNLEWVWGYRETDKIGGKDPYSASKGMAEIAIRSYVESFYKKKNSNIRIGIARAGNVIGGGDWAADRIVPDCMLAWANGKSVDIRSPNATRPWQHVLEPLSGYLTLSYNLFSDNSIHGEAYNFGPPANQNYSVIKLIEEMSKHWSQIKWNDISSNTNHVHEASLLKLNCDKALFDLDWHATLNFEDTVRMTVEWYKKFLTDKNQSMYEFSVNQILSYTKIAESNSLFWSKND